MARKLLETTKFTEDENADVLKALHQLKKREGYSFQEISRISGISMGGLIGFRKNTQISPNIATRLAEVFDYYNWQDMVEEFQKKERRKANQVVVKDWKSKMEERLNFLESEFENIRELLSQKHKIK